jgi:hypothetical protein
MRVGLFGIGLEASHHLIEVLEPPPLTQELMATRKESIFIGISGQYDLGSNIPTPAPRGFVHTSCRFRRLSPSVGADAIRM